MSNHVITPEELLTRLDTIVEMLNTLQIELSQNPRIQPAGKEYYTNQDMCAMLSISKRTLARYRQKKLISYYMTGGKIWYKVSEVAWFLKRKGKGSPEAEPTTPEKDSKCSPETGG